MVVNINTLPNQIKAISIQTEENLERIENVSKEKIWMQKSICKQKDSSSQTEDNSETREDDEKNIWIKGISLVATFIFTILAGYYISEVMIYYKSEPLMSTTNIIQNQTFQWPTITIEPYTFCYNKTALKELKKLYSITLTDLKNPYMPFDISDSSFNWSVNNVSEIYLKSKYRPPEANFTARCRYYYKGTRRLRCTNENTGKWEIYGTQYNTKQSFTPYPASSANDAIVIWVNSRHIICPRFIVALHPGTELYYNVHPSTRYFIVEPRSQYIITIAVEDFRQVSTRASPCVEDMNYSEAECYEKKIIEYKIKQAGCHFPAITGYQQQPNNYPECNNISSFRNFMFWHKELYYNGDKYEDLQRMKTECGVRCFTRRYIITSDKTARRPRKYGRSSKFTISLDTRAMTYVSVNEERAMTIDELVANVGGTLGLFLGISCLTIMNGIQSVIEKITIICGNNS